jgi:hypothetical protein
MISDELLNGYVTYQEESELEKEAISIEKLISKRVSLELEKL